MAVTKETALQVTIAPFCIDSLWHQFKAYLTHTDWLHFKSRTIFPYSGQIAVSPPPLHWSMDKDEQTTAQGPATDRLSGNVTHVHIKASWPDIWVLRRTLKSFIKNVLTFWFKCQGVFINMNQASKWNTLPSQEGKQIIFLLSATPAKNHFPSG